MFSAKTISRVYLILALLAVVILSPLSYLFIALVLILLQIYCIYKPLRADLNLVLTFSSLFIVPLTLQDLAGGLLAALFIIPALPLLDQNLREYTSNQNFRPLEGRRPTILLQTLMLAIFIVFVISLVLANWTLSLACALLATYFIAVSAYIIYSIPRDPLHSSYARIRIIVGDTSNVSLAIESNSKLTLHALFTSPHSWVDIDPTKLEIGKYGVKLNLALTPPLSGPSQPQFQAFITDPWGLIRMNYNLQPVEMHVIPKAKYARWLAKKFLGQVTPQTSTMAAMATLSSVVPIATRRGVEYMSSRPYLPGDMLKEMDWKHMSKFNKLIVKEYSEAKELFTIIVVNLTVKDPEEADQLAYKFMTLALTLAKAAIPSALVVYNHQETLLTTGIEDPKKILKRTLELEQDIVIVEPMHRFLQPPNMQRLRRTRIQLEQATTEPAYKMADFLRLENKAIQQRGRSHPVGIALNKVAEQIHPPAIVVVVSGWNHDAEALLATLDRLTRKGYVAIEV